MNEMSFIFIAESYVQKLQHIFLSCFYCSFSFFFFWSCLQHVEVPWARDQTCATAVTRAPAVTMLDS